MHDLNGREIDARLLVQWVGVEGARAALTTSRRCSVKVLRSIAEGLGCMLSKEMTRQQLIDDILDVAGKRIDKPLDALFQMSHDELVEYFTRIEVESKELLELLKELDIQPQRDGLRSLIELAAQQISETGRYMRIAASSSPDRIVKPAS
jgi:hypothetical protein